MISIVIPTLNQAEYIEITLESVLDQKNVNLETLIFDALSSDETPIILRKYKHIFDKNKINIKVIREADRGQSDGINKGWKIAKGQLLTYLNSDDYYEPNVLSKVVSYFKANPDTMWAYGGWNLVDASGEVLSTEIPNKYSYSKLLNYCNIGQPSCFFRSQLLEEFGHLDSNRHLAMDYDLWLRFATEYPAGIMPFVISNMRIHHAAKSSASTIPQQLEMLEIASKYTSWCSYRRLAQYYYFIRGVLSTMLHLDIHHRLARR